MSTLLVNNITCPGDVGRIVVPANNVLSAPGHVLQIQYATTGPTKQTIASLNPTEVTGLSISFTPKSSTSNILACATLLTNAVHVSSFAIYNNGAATVSTSGYTNSNEANMNLTTYIGSTTTDNSNNFSVYMQQASGSTTTRTYAVYASAGWGGTAYSLQINNRNSNDMAGFSYFWVMEIE